MHRDPSCTIKRGKVEAKGRYVEKEVGRKGDLEGEMERKRCGGKSKTRSHKALKLTFLSLFLFTHKL